MFGLVIFNFLSTAQWNPFLATSVDTVIYSSFLISFILSNHLKNMLHGNFCGTDVELIRFLSTEYVTYQNVCTWKFLKKKIVIIIIIIYIQTNPKSLENLLECK